ncbi:MAG: lyase family protein, partial [Bdellovibrionales bacterium]|nr:lyase family protein [Bdellovibrionales bacterium]
MIARYTREEMGRLWTQEARFECLKDVELAVAQAQSEMGIIPKEAFQVIQEKASFQVERILEIEKETKHDIIAFVSNLAENVGPEGRYLHYGMTSSDALDTALSVQVKKAKPLLMASLEKLLKALSDQSKNYKDTICSGRTHGMHAEPTTFGLKLAGFYAEFARHKKRLEAAFDQMAIGKISGAVGTYSFLKPEVEQKVCDILGLKPETVATQVIPRDRHAELFSTIALLGGGLERLC